MITSYIIYTLIYAIVPLNVKAISLNCFTRLLNQPQSTRVKHCEIMATWFRISLAGKGGVAWSNGQRRRLPLQGSKVRTPVVPFLFLKKNHKTTKGAGKKREKAAAAQERREKGKDRQANQEWIREVVRFVSKYD